MTLNLERMDMRLRQILKIKWLMALPAFFLFYTASTLFAQSVRVGPDGEFSPQTLKLPYAIYNENFGFAGGYVYGKVGKPQKQSFMLATAIVGTKGGMGFLRANPSLQFIDVTRAAGSTDGNGHNYFRQSPWVSSDLMALLAYDLGAARRGLEKEEKLPAWTYPPDYIERLRKQPAEINPEWAGAVGKKVD